MWNIIVNLVHRNYTVSKLFCLLFFPPLFSLSGTTLNVARYSDHCVDLLNFSIKSGEGISVIITHM